MAISRSSVENPARAFAYFWVAVLTILIAVWAIVPSQAQQSDLAESLRTYETGSCKVEHNACCGSCGSCDTGPRCPAGSSVYDDYCLPDCPPGQKRYPGNPGFCSPPCDHGCPEGYEPVPLPQCPDGYYRNLRNPDECLPYRDPDNANCAEGMTYSHVTGQCSPICLPGTYLNERGLCESYYTRECPANWQRNRLTGACVPPGDWPDDYTWMCLPLCPPNYTRDIYHPTRCIPPEDKCDQGYETYRDQCVPTCEPGARRNDYGYCVPPRCEDGSYPDLRGRCRQPECPKGHEEIRGQCYEPCRQGETRNQQNPERCERIPQDEPECRDGTRLNPQTQQCERIPQDPKCQRGFTYNTRTKRCDPPPRVEKPCKRGFVKTKEGRCIRLEKEEPDEPVFERPKSCGRGKVFSKIQGRCVSDRNQQEPQFDPEPNDELPTLRPGNRLKLPTFEKQQTPTFERQKQRCGEGEEPDGNGGCMPIQ